MEKTYRNVSYLFVGVLLLVFVGFYKTYFSLFPHFIGINPLLHIHATLIIAWFGMLIVQPILIRNKQFALHRRLGKASYWLMGLLVLTIILVVRNMQLREKNLAVFGFAFSDVSFLLLVYGLAIYYRHKSAFHARYMVMTVLPFLNPALGRLPESPIPGPVLGLLILIGLLVFEWFKTEVFRPYLIGIASFISIYAFFGLMTPTPAWDDFWGLFFGR